MSPVAATGDLLRAAGFGALVNFPWEMASTRFAGTRLLYRGVPGFTWKQHLVCCSLAALADGLAIAAIFAVGAALFRDPRWTRRRSPRHLAAAVLLGLAGAVITEWLALRLDWWRYGPAMPRVPGIGLGISPLAQFVVLPLAVLFWALPRWWAYFRHRDEAQRVMNEG